MPASSTRPIEVAAAGRRAPIASDTVITRRTGTRTT